MTPFGVFNKVNPAGVKMYPQNYPHRDIAFAHVSDYTDGVEEMLISAQAGTTNLLQDERILKYFRVVER